MMNPFPIILGKLQQVMESPGSVHCWHSLSETLRKTGDQNLARELFQHLSRYQPPTHESRYLHATFMHGLSGDIRYLEEAGRLAGEISPVSTDRIQSLLLVTYGYALRTARNRKDFGRIVSSIDAPSLLKKMSGILEQNVKTSFTPRRPATISRAAILTPDLSNLDNPATVMATRHARLFRNAGIPVEIFSPQEHELPTMKYFHGHARIFIKPSVNSASLRSELRNDIKMHLAVMEFSVLQRWVTITSKLIAFDPDVILFVGFFSPVPFLLYPHRPVIGLSIHTLAPLAPVDVWLSHDPEGDNGQESFWGDSLPTCHVHHHPHRITLKPLGKITSRQNLGLDPDALVLVTVGTRLHTEVNEAWAKRIMTCLVQHPEAQWLFVGGDGAILPALKGLNTERVKFLPYHSDVRAIMKCCDIYVNPPRMGGGFSVADAMAEGLPIVAYANSDGGDKIGRLASQDDDNFFARLTALLINRDQRQEEGQMMRREFIDNLDIAKGGPSLLSACRKAIASYAERIGRT